jgi:phosphorylcholine metabolism protein LicD
MTALLEKAFYDILKQIAVKYEFDYPEDKLIALSTDVDYDSTDDLLITADGPNKLLLVKKQWIEETIDATFEGIPCKISKYYDTLLKNQYGDYMTLPPENKRKDNHTYNSYYYKKDKKN